MRAVEILAPRHVVHFVGEMGTELRTVVGRVTGGSLVSNTWLGPVRRDPPGREPRADEGDPPLGRELRTNEGEPSPRREPRADEGAPSVDSEDENAEGGSLKGSPSKSRGESSGDERRGKAVENGVGGEVTKGGAEVDVDPTPSLEKWDEYVPEAPPSPPMSFASSQGVGPESEERGEEVSGRCTEGPGVSRGGTGRLQIDLTPCEGVEQSAECGGPLGESQDENLRESASQESAGQGSPSSKNPRSSKAKVNMGNGSPAKENIPPQGNGLRDGSGCSSETVEVVGLPPSARLKGGRPEGLGNASGTERNGTERNGTERIGTERSGMELNGGWEEAVLATEVVRNVGEGRRGAEVQNGDESVGRERKRGGELQRDQGDCGDSGVSGGEPTDQVASQSPEHECSARLGDDRSALKRKASSVRSPARAIPKNGAIYRAFERQGVAQPIPLPHQRARIRTYY